jgi:SAM-dependent methyltransferase
MSSLGVWILLVVGALLLSAFAYWQLVVAEGAYLGRRVVVYLYDLTARRYDAIKEFDPDLEAIFLGRPLMLSLQDRPSPLVLDVATGTGRLPLTLLEQPLFQGRVVGLDASHQMLEVAAEKLSGYGGRLTLIWCDATYLPFPDNVFDAVTCLEMLEFTPDPQHQLTELVRVLCPGGVLVTTRRRGLEACLMPGKTYSARTLEALLARLGLTHIQIQPWQVDYDLVWAVRSGYKPGGIQPLSEILCCPRCNKIALGEQEGGLQCSCCGMILPIQGSIINMMTRYGS